ncbi:RNA polymerase sigma factor [Paenibacillus camelliae]|uniref:RNA polymerase sigma factor n=1 Tax=Paenibacillus camelliae TaxID=512410 RepID=UPI00203A6F73|nr:RNA polymerase sigma factor [Paenibacillus camelliae]MCM3635850.1 RNA polymerase sigma factor [Paenibacillus camelliae]
MLINFKIIYEKHFRDVYRFIYSLCGDESLAEEITQETFLRALKHIDSFQGKCQMKVWLCQIAKNIFFTHQSKRKRISECEIDMDNSLTSQDQPLVKALAQKDEALRIHKIVHRLKEPYKEVFTLRIFGELSFAEISQLFNKSESWARVTFYRAKQMIHRRMEEEGSFE